MNVIETQARIHQARESLLAGRPLEGSLLPQLIAKSWHRCQQLGLDVEHRPRLEPLSSREMGEVRDRNEAFIRLCRPELEGMHSEARRTGSVIVLTDAQGLVLDRLGDVAFANRAAEVALRPGVTWGEAHTGTNAIGTALVEGRPVSVEGAAHYFPSNHILSCYAAPIIDPYGRTLGALDLSGPSDAPHTHALGMVRLAVEQIERRLFQQDFADAHVLQVHLDPNMLGSFREGLLAFREGRLIAANRVAMSLFRLSPEDLGQRTADELLGQTIPAHREHHTLVDPRGRELHLRQRSAQRPQRTETRSLSAPIPSSTPMVAPEVLITRAHIQDELSRAAAMLDGGLPVLVQGETGVGKEVFARNLHRHSARGSKPFIAINCAALPENLIEAELFGYEEGAFTGARRKGAPGLLRQADGGTLFLDEIGDMPALLQSRLLRVLQEREVIPLGGGQPQPIDIQLICATHQDLPAMIAAGSFRADLYYRIAQYCCRLPALRDEDDLAPLIQELWSRLHGPGQSTAPLAADITQRLASHHWPGNYRQLQATLRRLYILSSHGHTPRLTDLPPEIGTDTGPEQPADLRRHTDQRMREAVAEAGGNISAAARRLGINRSTLYRRILHAEASGSSKDS